MPIRKAYFMYLLSCKIWLQRVWLVPLRRWTAYTVKYPWLFKMFSCFWSQQTLATIQGYKRNSCKWGRCSVGERKTWWVGLEEGQSLREFTLHGVKGDRHSILSDSVLALRQWPIAVSLFLGRSWRKAYHHLLCESMSVISVTWAFRAKIVSIFSHFMHHFRVL